METTKARHRKHNKEIKTDKDNDVYRRRRVMGKINATNEIKKSITKANLDNINIEYIIIHCNKILMEERVRRGIDTNTGDVRYG